jgi:DNA-binding transcriptional MerR regulator
MKKDIFKLTVLITFLSTIIALNSLETKAAQQPEEKLNSYRLYEPSQVDQQKIIQLPTQVPVQTAQTIEASSSKQDKTPIKAISALEDVHPDAEYFQELKTLIEQYSVSIRPFSDGTFKGELPITRAEAIDWLGSALDKMYTLGEAACPVLHRPAEVPAPADIDQKAYYFESYKTLLRGLPEAVKEKRLIYGIEKEGRKLNGNDNLTNADTAVILNRYFLRVLERFLTSPVLSQTDSSILIASIPLNSSSTEPLLIVQAPSVSEITDVPKSEWYYGDVKEVVERWNLIDTSDHKFRPNQVTTRAQFVLFLSTALERAKELVSKANSKCSVKTPTTESTIDNSKILVPISFAFKNAQAYSLCVEDVLQLYIDRKNFQKNGRTSDCLPDIFQAYSEKGLSKNQALELLQAANVYATKDLSIRMFPLQGQRSRIQQFFGFAYEIDAPK